jgi:hypothetical protein
MLPSVLALYKLLFNFRVDFHLTKPPIDVKAAFEDNTVTGLSTFKLNSISADKCVQYTVH